MKWIVKDASLNQLLKQVIPEESLQKQLTEQLGLSTSYITLYFLDPNGNNASLVLRADLFEPDEATIDELLDELYPAFVEFLKERVRCQMK